MGKHGKKQNIAASLILSNLVLVACTVAFLGTVIFLYQKKIQNVTLAENRFLTTEWHLLQELKAQTDQQLRDKDLEISRLRSEYRKLKQEERTPDRMLELEAELKKAEAERAAILSSRLSAIVTPPPVTPSAITPSVATGLSLRDPDTQRTSVAALDTAAPAKPVTELLGQRIQELEIQVAAQKLRTETAEKKLKDYIQDTERRRNAATSADSMIELLEQKKKELEQEPPPKIEDIKTRSLLRAIVSSPAIRQEYPDLLESLDRYFEVYGRQEWITGKKDAYQFTIDSLKTLESKKQD